MTELRILAFLATGASLLLATAQPAAAQGKDTGSVNYTFKSGDTLEGLAGRYLVSIDSSQTVQRLNGIKDPTKIRPGTILKVPTSLLKGTPIAAKVVAFSGSVTILGKNGGTAPVIGSAILEGQTLSTGAPGFLTISISGGSNVSIPSKSRVRILRLRKYLLTGGSDIDLFVEHGRAETAAAPIKDGNSRFKMRTPTAVSAVRGTVFRIGYDGPESSSFTEVVEGAVAVDSGANAQALVPKGFGAAVSKTGQLVQEALLPAPQITNAGALQTDNNVQFHLSTVAGAKGYHTQLARDAGFLDIFSETVSGDAIATFADVPDGSFFVRTMAIADSGLLGLTDAFGFRRRLATINASETAASLDGTVRIKWVKQGVGSTVYRFQLFEEANREIPMIDEPGLETSDISLTNLRPGSYSWRVGMLQMATDGVVEVWSQPQHFTISG